ncbi:hypothetical protein D3C81_1103230 [compost metagenome]
MILRTISLGIIIRRLRQIDVLEIGGALINNHSRITTRIALILNINSCRCVAIHKYLYTVTRGIDLEMMLAVTPSRIQTCRLANDRSICSH